MTARPRPPRPIAPLTTLAKGVLKLSRTCPGRPGLERSSALSVLYSKSVLYGAFVWVRRTLNHQKPRFPARAVSRMTKRKWAASERLLLPLQIERSGDGDEHSDLLSRGCLQVGQIDRVYR